MPTEGVPLLRTRDEIVADMKADLLGRVTDAYTGDDGTLSMLLEIFGGTVESVFFALEVLAEDMFVQTANETALDRHGDDYGISRKLGAQASGTLLFSGDGGAQVNIGDEVAYDPGTGVDPLYFTTTESGTIPNPGTPTAPTLTDLALAGNLTGTFEYAITFTTAAGETEIGAESAALNVAASQIHLANIPVGGAGTLRRRIYRQKDGSGVYQFVAEIADNVTTTYDDNIADGALGGNPPAASTAQSISIAAQAEEAGTDYNVVAGAITVLTNVQDGITTVTNPAPFAGGNDDEATEDYRIRLLDAIRNPGTGSPSDLKSWAEQDVDVETATVFENDNLGVATNGHSTIRISGYNGVVPDATVIDRVQATLDGLDYANMTLHVAAFTQTPTDVTVTITLASGYSHADVDSTVQQAISDYINGLEVGETLRISGITTAVYGLPGVLDVVVNVPASNQATGATSKRTVGTITVS